MYICTLFIWIWFLIYFIYLPNRWLRIGAEISKVRESDGKKTTSVEQVDVDLIHWHLSVILWELNSEKRQWWFYMDSKLLIQFIFLCIFLVFFWGKTPTMFTNGTKESNCLRENQGRFVLYLYINIAPLVFLFKIFLKKSVNLYSNMI